MQIKTKQQNLICRRKRQNCFFAVIIYSNDFSLFSDMQIESFQ